MYEYVKPRTRVTLEQRASTRPASAKEYTQMRLAASEVVMYNRGREYRSGEPEYVIITFPHWVVFTDDFPKGVLVSKTRVTDTRKINAVKLLDWLYQNKHSEYDSGMLVKETKVFEILEGKIDRMFKGETDDGE